MPIDIPIEQSSSYHRSREALCVLARAAGAAPYDDPEQITVAFSYVLEDGGAFAGRMHVESSPQFSPDGERIIHLRVTSRRYVRETPLQTILDRCHADIVEGFTAITTPQIQEEWGRFK